MKGFSIRRPSAKENVQVETQVVKEPEPTYEDKPVDNVNLTIEWRKFAHSLPHEDVALSHQLDNMEPMLQEDGTTFLVIADNPVLQQELTKRQPAIEAFLRKGLQNKQLCMTTRLREVTDKRRVFTRVEIFNQMLQQSEALRKLKEEFELELA
jgi:DNA polymerase-3 subunit gamma/tau